jgi:hypothetical protein
MPHLPVDRQGISKWAVSEREWVKFGVVIAALRARAVDFEKPNDLDSKKRREEALTRVRNYQAAGVSIVWAINPDSNTVEVYHPDQSNAVQVLGANDELTGEDVIPGFKVAVSRQFDQS